MSAVQNLVTCSYELTAREIVSGHAKLDFALLLRGRPANRNRRAYNKKKVRALFREPYLNRVDLPKVTISKLERTQYGGHLFSP